jgi:hypothetical protein
MCCWCAQKRPATLCFAKQSSYELGTLAYRIITGSVVVQGTALPGIPDLYPHKLHTLLPQLVAKDPGTFTLSHHILYVDLVPAIVVCVRLFGCMQCC